MAKSTIKQIAKKGIGTEPITGVSCEWERIGNIVTVKATITKPDTSWTLCRGLPLPQYDVPIGFIGDADKIIHLVWVNISGLLQCRTSAFSEVYHFSGCYLCK